MGTPEPELVFHHCSETVVRGSGLVHQQKAVHEQSNVFLLSTSDIGLPTFDHLWTALHNWPFLRFDHPRRPTNACGLGEPESAGSS